MFQISTMANLETEFHELLKLWWLVEEYIYIKPTSSLLESDLKMSDLMLIF